MQIHISNSINNITLYKIKEPGIVPELRMFFRDLHSKLLAFLDGHSQFLAPRNMFRGLTKFSRNDNDYENGNTLVVRFRTQATLVACSPRQNSKTEGIPSVLLFCRGAGNRTRTARSQTANTATMLHPVVKFQLISIG